MKLNVLMSSKKKRFTIDVDQSSLIWEVKRIIAEVLNLSISLGNREKYDANQNKDYYIQLFFNRITLRNDCTVEEMQLQSGSTIHCKLIYPTPYILQIAVPCLSKKITFENEVSITETKIGDLRGILQNKLGLPVSTFWLQKKDDRRLLFDNQLLSYYDVNNGDTLILDVWEEIEELLVAAMTGDISHTLSLIPNYWSKPSLNRYCLRVILFIAAHTNEVNLAAEILQRKVR